MIDPFTLKLPDMFFPTRTRRWLASWLSLALLLTQFAVAAYACPGGRPVAYIADTAVASAAMAGMPDCAAMSAQSDRAQPLLCKAHCDQDKQSVNSAYPLDLPSLAQILSFVVARIDYATLPLPPIGHSFSDREGPPRGTPPVYLALQVLRN